MCILQEEQPHSIQSQLYDMNKLLEFLDKQTVFLKGVVLTIFFGGLTLGLMWYLFPLLADDSGFLPYKHHLNSCNGTSCCGGLVCGHLMWTFGAIIPLTWVYLDVKARQIKKPFWFWSLFAVMVLLGTYFGARTFHYVGPWGSGWFEVNGFWNLKSGGAVFYGGLFGIFAASFFYLKILKEKAIAMFFDIIAPSIAFTSFFTRLLDCFFIGDDFGIASTLPWSIFYSEGPYRYLLFQSLHPVQIYLALGNLLLLLILLEVRRVQKWHGQVFVAYATIYPIMRFALEFFRDTNESKASALTMLTYSQMISLGLLITVLGYLLFKHRRRGS